MRTLSRDHGRCGRDGHDAGQSLVEFALVFPLFFLLLLFVIEFGLLFAATLNVNFATRNASLIAAEAGNQPWADCVILQQVEKDMGPPLNRAQIQRVWIFKTDRAGDELSPKVQMAYDRGGALSCTGPNGVTITVPYQLSSTESPNNTYPADPMAVSSRCDQLAGCSVGSGNVPLDSIGVKIMYRYSYVTPIGGLLTAIFGGCTGLPSCSAGQIDLTWSNVMRMEPIL